MTRGTVTLPSRASAPLRSLRARSVVRYRRELRAGPQLQASRAREDLRGFRMTVVSATASPDKPYQSLRDPPFTKDAKVVIVGGGPAGLHFAHRMAHAGYKHKAVVLESADRVGGKSHTKTVDSFPTVRHEMGTCYMHLGYKPVRDLFEQYGLGDQEVELGKAYTDLQGDGVVRKVWDLEQKNDFSRGDHKGQDFDDWILTEVDRIVHAGKATPKVYREDFEKLMKEAKQDLTGLKQAARSKDKDAPGEAEIDLDAFEKTFADAMDAGKRSHDEDPERKGDYEDAEGREVEGAARVVAALRVFVAARKYLALHREMFGEYNYGLPPRPRKPEELNKTFIEWLHYHDLDALKPFFIYSQAAQGYGSMETVPALYGLWWNAPGYIDPTFNPLKQALINKPAQAVLKCGFSALWENMVTLDGLDVRTRSAVTKIERPSARGDKPVVWYTQVHVTRDSVGKIVEEKEEEHEIEADFVVLTAPLKEAMQAGVFEPSPAEHELLSKLKILSLKTTLFRTDAYPKGDPVYPGEVWVGPLNKFNGHVRYLSNSDLSVSGRNIEARPAYVVYQALDRPPTDESNAELRKQFYTDVGEGGIGLKNVELLYEKNWAYFPHFPQDAVKDEAPWKLLEEQGKDGILFGGSSCCFESVLDVMAYNDVLFEMFQLE